MRTSILRSVCLNATPVSIVLIVFAMVLTLSCDNTDILPVKPLTSYYISYMMNAGSGIMPEPDNAPIVTIEYNAHGRPITRKGALVSAPYFTGFTHRFAANFYDDVTYGDSKITIIKKIDDPVLHLKENRKELFLENGKIKQAIILGWRDYTLDTINFFYVGSTLWKTVTKSYRFFGDHPTYTSETQKRFTFSNGNLEKIEGIEYGWRKADGPLYTTLEIFSDYDNSPNPTWRLIIFDEVFLRALSRNNFRKYQYERRKISGELTSQEIWSWSFQYNTQRIPTFLH